MTQGDPDTMQLGSVLPDGLRDLTAIGRDMMRVKRKWQNDSSRPLQP
jgi:hypothetical protein